MPGARTIDVVYRFDPAKRARLVLPRTPKDALGRLVRGNRAFASLSLTRGGRSSIITLEPSDVGHDVKPGVAPVQRPFAAVLGCSDARVPIEMVFQQRANDLFVVRVAGNGLGSGCVGSLRYAREHFSSSLRLVVVLGHSQCGAVTAAVDAFLKPKNYLPLASNFPVRSIVDPILVAVRAASLALEDAHPDHVIGRRGYRAALVETSSILNAALAAYALEEELASRTCRVVFGWYDLASRLVSVPRGANRRAGRRDAGLLPPPHDDAKFRGLAREVARSVLMRTLLAG